MVKKPPSQPPSPPRPAAPRGLLAVVAAVLAGLGYWQFGSDADRQATPATAPASALHVVVAGPNGPTDIGPTLERIAAGVRHPHRRDGSVFGNHEKRLPLQPNGYYREFVHAPIEQADPGAQRLVIGKDGAVYYTPDHYQTFQRSDYRFRTSKSP